MTAQQTLFEKDFKPRPIRLGSPDAQRLKVGKLNATQRSLAYLRKQGWTVDVAEKFVTHGGTKAQDDYIAELLEQRTELIRRLKTLPLGTFTMGTPADVEVAEGAMKRFLAGLVEPRRPSGRAGYRRDLFGFTDILAFRADETLAVQTTSFQQVAAHLRAFRRDEDVREVILDWIAGENRTLVLHGWRCMEVAKKNGKGTKAEWQVREELVSPSSMLGPLMVRTDADRNRKQQ